MNPHQFKDGLNRQTDFKLKLYLIITAILLIISYGIFTARDMIAGPSIKILAPLLKEIETKENILEIRGSAFNVISLSINERIISIDTRGSFEEKLLLIPGFNTIEIKGKDRFRKEVKETIKVYYNQQ